VSARKKPALRSVSLARGKYRSSDPSLERYGEYLERIKSDRTVEEYVRELEIFGAWLAKRLRADGDPFEPPDDLPAPVPPRWWAREPFAGLETAPTESVVGFLQWIHRRRLSPTAQRRTIAALRSYYKYLRAKGVRDDNPTLTIELPKRPIRVLKTIPTESIAAMRDRKPLRSRSEYAALRDRAIIAFLFSGGVRRAELVGLNRSKVDLDRREVTVLGKGNKERVVIIDEPTAELLRLYLARRGAGVDDALFLGKEVQPGMRRRISYDYIRELVARFARNAGIEGRVTPHMFRHSLATYLYERGMDLTDIKDQLGHSSTATTDIYVKGSTTARKQRYDRVMGE
jgi:integrase/recombinase XerC